MAAGEARKIGTISQVSWTDGTSQDVYYGLEHSFQYSSNINCDDEMHGIKLSQYAQYIEGFCPKSQLVSCGDNGVMALRVDGQQKPIMFKTFGTPIEKPKSSDPNTKVHVCPGVIFQDKFWYGVTITETGTAGLYAIDQVGAGSAAGYAPQDHTDYTDEAISTSMPQGQLYMNGTISAILNYNNTRLVVAVGGGADGAAIWVYYPELDNGSTYTGIYGQSGWKKVLEFEAGVNIVALTCTFEYLKVWAVDEGWNTKVYYYQGNNNLRSTFVYNIIDLTGVRVTRVYSINGIDYYTSSIDGTDGYVTLYKMVGNTPVELFHVRGGLDPLDVNFKAPYFVGPVGINAAYNMGKFYIADAYGLFQFRYNPEGFDKGYMKRQFRNQNHNIDSMSGSGVIQPYGVCFNRGFLYVSDSNGCWKVRAYDTGKDGYQEEGVIISREYEGKEGGTVTKMLDEIRLNYELNPLADDTGSIDVYVSPNNLWKSTTPEGTGLPDDMSEYKDDDSYDGWFHVMHIDKTNQWTRTERVELFNNLQNKKSSFRFDWQTITYAIVIKQPDNEHATPIVRQIDINYHTKDKTNYVYNIK